MNAGPPSVVAADGSILEGPRPSAGTHPPKPGGRVHCGQKDRKVKEG